MLYFCVKTEEYLRSILDIVSRGASHYKWLDVSQDKALTVIQKFTARYSADMPRHRRSYALNKQELPVFDLVILHNKSLKKATLVRLCVLATLPKSADLSNGVSKYIYESTGMGFDKGDFERFYAVDDRKTRLCYMTTGEKPQAVYELLQLPYTTEEMQAKGITKPVAWTWRLHKDFIKIKQTAIERSFKDAQKRKDKQLNSTELQILWNMAGFRGVRDDIFKVNRSLFALSHKYLNRPLDIDLQVPRYTMKKRRLAQNFEEMEGFHV